MTRGWVVGLVAFGLVACTPPDDDDDTSITVEVVDGTAPVSGVEVLFHDADGVLVDRGQTDAAAPLKMDLPAGTTVTAMWQDVSGFRVIQSFLDVQPGDHLILLRNLNQETATVNLTFPADFPGATGYFLRIGCEQYIVTALVPTTLDVPMSCVHNGELTVSMQADQNPASAFTYVEGVAVSADTPADVTLPAWRTDFDSVQVDVTNIPPSTGLSVSAARLTHPWYVIPSDFASANPPGVNETFNLSLPAGVGDAQSVVSGVRLSGSQYLTMSEGVDGASSSVTMDYANALPALADFAVGLPDPAQPIMDWTGQPADTQYVSAFLNWLAGDGGLWVVFEPSDMEPGLVFPELPADLSAWFPPGDLNQVGANLSYYDDSWVSDYSEIVNRNGATYEPPRVRTTRTTSLSF